MLGGEFSRIISSSSCAGACSSYVANYQLRLVSFFDNLKLRPLKKKILQIIIMAFHRISLFCSSCVAPVSQLARTEATTPAISIDWFAPLFAPFLLLLFFFLLLMFSYILCFSSSPPAPKSVLEMSERACSENNIVGI